MIRGLVGARLFRPLHHRDFRLLWIGQTASNFGNFVYLVAVPFQILALGGGPLELGAMLAITTGVRLVFLLYGGAVVDRVPRRAVILSADLVRGVLVLIVAVMGYLGALRVEHLYALAVAFGVASAFSVPALTAVVPDLVPKEILIQGNALGALSRQIGRLTGALLGGITVGFFGPPTGFLVDAVTFFASYIALSMTRPVAPNRRPAGNLIQQMREGLSYVLATRWLLITLIVTGITNATMFGPLIVGLPVLVRDVLNAGPAAFGLISMALGAGEIAGSVVISRLAPQALGTVFYVLITVAGLSVGAIGLTTSLPVVMSLAAIHGGSIVAAGAVWESALQRNVPKELLGRVASVDHFSGLWLAPVAPIVVAILVAGYGSSLVFLWGGVLTAAMSLVVLAVPTIRRVR